MTNPAQVDHGRPARSVSGFKLDFTNRLVSQILITALITLMTIQVFGGISNLAQIAIVLALLALHWKEIAQNLPGIWGFLLLPLLAAASFIWSDAPDVSLRYGLQFLFTVFAGLMIPILIGPTRFVTSIYISSVIVALGSLMSGRYGNSMEGPVMIGLTGSKNQMAFVSQLTLASSAAIFLDTTQSKLLRASTVVAALIALALLIQAHSATGILTAIGATAAFVGLLALKLFKPPVRVALIAGALIIVTPAVVMKDALIEQAAHISETVFKKDATLTGRTYLWAHADRLIEQNPVVGHGYRAVWLGNSVTTTGLLRWAGLTDGRGFNFHNTYKEVTVDTGYVGLVIFTATLAGIGLMLLGRFVADGSLAMAFFFSTYLTYGARSFTELILGPFASTTLILFALGGYGVLKWEEERRRAPVTPAAPTRGASGRRRRGSSRTA